MPASSYRDFSKLPVSFAGLYLDLDTGELIVSTSGSLMQTIRAAISIPSLFTPFEHGWTSLYRCRNPTKYTSSASA
jgi:predicted acylesterase/phospholipase RssA